MKKKNRTFPQFSIYSTENKFKEFQAIVVSFYRFVKFATEYDKNRMREFKFDFHFNVNINFDSYAWHMCQVTK